MSLGSPALCLVLALATAPVGAAPSLDFAEAIAQVGRTASVLEARSAEVTAAREIAAQADQLPDPQLVLGIENLPVGSSPFDLGDSEMTSAIRLRRLIAESRKHGVKKEPPDPIGATGFTRGDAS